MENGSYHPTKNLRRAHFALMADAPNVRRPHRRSDNHGGRGQNVLSEDGNVRFVVSTRLKPRGDDFFSNDRGLMAAGVHRDDSVIGGGTARPLIYVSNHR
jgi:hypothetical protein